jgi:hypothetical protein
LLYEARVRDSAGVSRGRKSRAAVSSVLRQRGRLSLASDAVYDKGRIPVRPFLFRRNSI